MEGEKKRQDNTTSPTDKETGHTYPGVPRLFWFRYAATNAATQPKFVTVLGGTFTMPDEISQALPEGQLEAEVQETTPQQETPTEPQTEKPITLEDVRKLLRDEVTPIIQSQVAKGENRIEKRIQERFAALEQNKGALKLTDEQVATAQQEIIREEQMNAYKPQANPRTNGEAQPDADPNGMERFVTDQIEQVFKKHGDRVTPNDAEFKIIESAWNDPNGSLADTLLAVNEATQKMLERKALQKKNADARVVSGGESKTNQPKPKSAEEKISAGLKASKWPSQEPTKAE